MSKVTGSPRVLFVIAVFSLLLFGVQTAAIAQKNDTETLKAQAKALIDVQKFTEALPLYEALVKQIPNDAEVRLNLGFALLGKATTVEDPVERRQLRVRARDSFVLAKSYGDRSLLVQGMIDGMAPDGSDPAGFSDNAEANKLMQKGEAYFGTGKLDEALKAYTDALAIDPRCYHAALFAGDVSMNSSDFAAAEKWYQKAISIDPFIETAYRYSATPFMKQKKYDVARDRYVESFIVEPYNRLALSGISQWGQITQTQLSHPKIDIPQTTLGADGKYKTTINLDPAANDGSIAWSSYVATRELWRTGKFAKQFPRETQYRHSVFEEADALRSVVSVAKALKPKTLNPQIALLAKMDQEGVLEAYIIMAIPDNGIAEDQRAYLIAHRDKLRQYVVNYVIGPMEATGE